MPEKKNPRRRIFFGWWSVLFIGIASGVGHGFNTYGISEFFKPIAAELNLSRAATSWAPGIGRLEGGVTSPLVGWLSDKFGPRWIVVIGICIAATGLILMNFITEVWQYYVAWGALIGLGLNIGLTVACDKKINDWFIHRRGLAQGIKFGLIGAFGVIVVLVIQPLIDTQGWRGTCLIWGIVMFATVPLAFWLIKPRRPEYYGMLPDGADIDQDDKRNLVDQGIGYASSFEETEYTFREAIKTRTYWLLIGAFSVHNVITGGFNLHVHPFLTDIGIDQAAASGMLGMMVFFTVPARLVGGIYADRVPKGRLQYLLTAAFLLQVIGLGSYLLTKNLASVYVLLVCHGLSTGAVMPLVILILGRYFGRKSFGSILGTVVAFLSPVGMLSPVFYGWVHDTTSSYDMAFLIAAILAVLATLTTFFIRVPRQSANATGSPTW